MGKFFDFLQLDRLKQFRDNLMDMTLPFDVDGTVTVSDLSNTGGKIVHVTITPTNQNFGTNDTLYVFLSFLGPVFIFVTVTLWKLYSSSSMFFRWFPFWCLLALLGNIWCNYQLCKYNKNTFSRRRRHDKQTILVTSEQPNSQTVSPKDSIISKYFLDH